MAQEVQGCGVRGTEGGRQGYDEPEGTVRKIRRQLLLKCTVRENFADRLQTGHEIRPTSSLLVI